MPSLVWNQTLSDKSASYGSACVWAHSCTSSKGCGYGENLAAAADSKTVFPIKTWKQQMDDWKNEEKDWTCSTNTCASGKVCGHATQLFWKSTASVGCGIVKCPDKTIFTGYPTQQYMICQYFPAGNFIGQHPLGSAASCPPTVAGATPEVIPGSTPVAPVTPPPVAPLGAPVTPPPAPVAPVTPITPPRAPYTPPTVPVPGAPKWAKCIGDYWIASKSVPTLCKRAPGTISGGLYCDVGDPQGYWWPTKNKDTPDCPYSVGALIEDSDSQQDNQMLPMEAWIGIAVGIAVFIIIIIVIIIVVTKSKKDERV